MISLQLLFELPEDPINYMLYKMDTGQQVSMGMSFFFYVCCIAFPIIVLIYTKRNKDWIILNEKLGNKAYRKHERRCGNIHENLDLRKTGAIWF